MVNGKIAYSLKHKTYYIISEWRDLQYLPSLEAETELKNQNQITGTEIVSSSEEAIDDVEGLRELSRRNRKPPPAGGAGSGSNTCEG